MDVSALSCPVVVTSKCMFFRHFFITVLLCSFLPTRHVPPALFGSFTTDSSCFVVLYTTLFGCDTVCRS
jgi:hypothetical protein